MRARFLLLLVATAISIPACGSGAVQDNAAPAAANAARPESQGAAELTSAWLAGRWQAGEAGGCGAGDTFFTLEPDGRYAFMEEQGRWTLDGNRLTIEVTHASSDGGNEAGERNTSIVRPLGPDAAEWTPEGRAPVRVTRCR